MENLVVNHFFPKFQIWTQFVKDSLMSALDLDGLRSSHPIEVLKKTIYLEYISLPPLTKLVL